MTHYHFIGIGGTGLAPIARILLEQGHTVSGSDRAPSPLTDDLVPLGVRLFIGHTAEQIRGASVVIRSSAIPDENPEVQAALQAGIPVMKRMDFLSALTRGKQVIAIAGTHGKTTTTAMIAWMFSELDLDPSYVIGSTSKDLKRNAAAGNGPYFIIEADEYDRMFLGLHPSVEVITYVEHDHPDCFPTFAEYQHVFRQFVRLLETHGLILVNHDQDESLALKKNAPVGSRIFSFGTLPGADYRAEDLHINAAGGYSFLALQYTHDPEPTFLADLELRVPGVHNVRNALAALAVAHQMGWPVVKAASAISSFTGTSRRFDVLGEAAGIIVIDDYAHHPTEISATLEAASSRFPGKRIWAVWQPHTYSRLQALKDGFTQAFTNADQVVITEVYAAREQNPGFSMQEFCDGISHPHLHFIPQLEDATKFLLTQLHSGDVLLVLSAGDADRISANVLERLHNKEVHHG